jgi:hypothetical protein
MDVAAVVGAFKHSCDKNFVLIEKFPADGAKSFITAVNAVITPPDMHQVVPSPGYGRKNQCFDKVASVKRH